MPVTIRLAAAAAAILSFASAQTFQRFGTCPTLGCVIPPDQQDFLAGQYFDIRAEVHAPVNGSEATNGVPDANFTFTIGKVGGESKTVSEYFSIQEPVLERWNFTWFEYAKRMVKALLSACLTCLQRFIRRSGSYSIGRQCRIQGMAPCSTLRKW
jgi:hypothetical protein